MNTLLESRFHQADTMDFRCDDVWFVRKAKRRSPDQRRSGLRSLKASVRSIESRRDDLARTHWKKVWHSMIEEDVVASEVTAILATQESMFNFHAQCNIS